MSIVCKSASVVGRLLPPVPRHTFLRVLIFTGLLIGGASSGGIASADSPHPMAHIVRDESCIGGASSGTAAPSKPGDQFVVRSAKAQEADAVDVANAIRSLKVFQTYEKGLGLTSLLQPGQPGPFPILISEGKLSGDGSFDGLFAPQCGHPTWGSLIVDGTTASDPAYMDAVVVHELFHAAQFALLRELTTGSNWWFEATATAAEYWMGLSPDEGVQDVTDHPEVPMDFLSASAGRHQYAAYVFVQWLLNTDGMPTAANWAFLKESILKVRELGATAGVDAALKETKESLADEVASFWADHTNQNPAFGPRAKLKKVSITQPQHTLTTPTAQPLAARLPDLVPAGNIEQVELKIHKLPAGLELWINLGKGSFSHLHPGDSFDELFCRNGYAEGSLPLPATEDIRLALTTTAKTAPSSVNFKVLTSKTPCPGQHVIVPGFEVGPLHLGMTTQEADTAAKLAHAFQPISCHLGDGSTCQLRDYSEGLNAPVIAMFRNGRIAYLSIVGNRRFTTTTGITTWTFLDPDHPPNPWVVVGSTASDFQHSAQGVSCRSVNTGG